MIRLAGIVHESITDGPGLRVTLFFQGCTHHCPGCHNPHTWDAQGGRAYEIDELYTQLNITPLIKGVTLSGGEPFLQPAAAAAVAAVFKQQGRDVWAYTGFRWETLLANPDPDIHTLIELCDVMVDGPFVQSQRQPGLIFRGSANQRLIAVQSSLEQGQVVLWQPPQD